HDALTDTGAAVAQLLRWEHRDLAEVFAGQAPAPGGMFTRADWEETRWGPRLATATTWAGLRLETTAAVGWSSLVTCTVEHVEIGTEPDPLLHRRGRYAHGHD